MISEEGNVSSMRVMSFLCIILGGAIAFYGLHTTKDLIGLAALVGVFVGPAIGGKIIQKFAELKGVIDDKESN